MVRNIAVWMMLMGCGLLMTACGAKRPVFYPNAHLYQVGRTQSRMDMDHCMDEARHYGIDDGIGREVGRRAIRGAVVAGATSAAVAAIWGGHVARAAGAGAVGGATAGAISGAFDAGDPDGVFKRYVERCLRNKGYDVIGWQ